MGIVACRTRDDIARHGHLIPNVLTQPAGELREYRRTHMPRFKVVDVLSVATGAYRQFFADEARIAGSLRRVRQLTGVEVTDAATIDLKLAGIAEHTMRIEPGMIRSGNVTLGAECQGLIGRPFAHEGGVYFGALGRMLACVADVMAGRATYPSIKKRPVVGSAERFIIERDADWMQFAMRSLAVVASVLG